MKPIVKNMSLSVVSRIVTMLTGLIVQNRILVAYGSTLNGLTSSITQVMSYLSLLEAGLGMAAVQALYSPFAKGDWDTISGIITATDKEYRKITAGFVVLLVVTSITYPLLVEGQVEYALSSILTFIIGASYIVSYILGAKYKSLLMADQKIYILYILEIISVVLSCVCRLVAVELGMSIVVVQLINLACIVVKNVGYLVYVKHQYRQINYQAKPLVSLIGKRWNVLVHSIAGLVVNQTDILILTIGSTLPNVSIYSVYYMVFGQISAFIQMTFMQAPQATFGKIYYEKKHDMYYYYKMYEFLFTIFLFLICSVALCLTLPFVKLYTRGVTDAEYIDALLPILFMLTLFMSQIRVPALIMINVVGHYKETQKGALIESLINIIVSLVLFWGTELGMYGLLIGTVCSYCYRTIDVIVYSYRHILYKSIREFFRLIIPNVGCSIVIFIFFYLMFPIQANSYLGWVIEAIAIGIICMISYCMVNYMFNKEHFKRSAHVIIHRCNCTKSMKT